MRPFSSARRKWHLPPEVKKYVRGRLKKPGIQFNIFIFVIEICKLTRLNCIFKNLLSYFRHHKVFRRYVYLEKDSVSPKIVSERCELMHPPLHERPRCQLVLSLSPCALHFKYWIHCDNFTNEFCENSFYTFES